MCAEYNLGGGGETGKELYKSFAFLFSFDIENGTLYLDRILLALGSKMSVVSTEGSQELGFLLEMHQNRSWDPYYL